ncbi:MAG: hypothetical protein K0U59_06070 [Gammaproteobacteria bacterium]|nr:hypothetical protein [Gammaproteobacteria bacterium]
MHFMACYIEVKCPCCKQVENILKRRLNRNGVQRYICLNQECFTKTFVLEYHYKAFQPSIKEQAIDMAISGSGVRDTARGMGISKATILSTLKSKESVLTQVSPNL